MSWKLRVGLLVLIPTLLALVTPAVVSASVFHSSLLILNNTVRFTGGGGARGQGASFLDETPRAIGSESTTYQDYLKCDRDPLACGFYSVRVDETITTRLLADEISLEQAGRYILSAPREELPNGIGFSIRFAVAFEVGSEPLTIELFHSGAPGAETGTGEFYFGDALVTLTNAESRAVVAVADGFLGNTRYDDYTSGEQISSGTPIPILLEVGSYELTILNQDGVPNIGGTSTLVTNMYAGLRVINDGAVQVPEPAHLSFGVLLIAVLFPRVRKRTTTLAPGDWLEILEGEFHMTAINPSVMRGLPSVLIGTSDCS